MTHGKIERYHRSIKNVIKLQNCYYPRELEQAIQDFVDYYINYHYNESLDYLAPEGVNFVKVEEVKSYFQL